MLERRRKRTRGELVVMAIAAVAVVALPAYLLGDAYLKTRAENVALAKSYSVEGHPCPQLTAAQFEALHVKKLKGLNYEGVIFYRQFGHVECSLIHSDGGTGLGGAPMCQFTGPAVLRVKTDKGEWFFNPGVGQPASVATPKGVAHCVMASNFRIG